MTMPITRRKRRGADPYRSLLAAIFNQALDDLRDDHRHYAAAIWLQSETARQLAAYLDIDLPRNIIQKRKGQRQHGSK